MANAKRDANRVPTLIGVSTADGKTPLLAEIDPTTGELLVKTSIVPLNYDYIALSYTGDNLTEVVFKSGGAGGTIKSTLTLAYTGSVLDSVTKT